MQTVSQTILVIGEKSVGKSDIINHLTNGSFNSEFYPNNGQDYSVKLARFPQPLSFQVTKIFEVQPIFWDGKSYGLITFYSQIADIILFVIDITKEEFDQDIIVNLYKAASEQHNYEYFKELKAEENIQPLIILCGNLKGKHPTQRNNTITQWLSQFSRLNNVALFELDSCEHLQTAQTFQDILAQSNKPQENKCQISAQKPRIFNFINKQITNYMYTFGLVKQLIRTVIVCVQQDLHCLIEQFR